VEAPALGVFKNKLSVRVKFSYKFKNFVCSTLSFTCIKTDDFPPDLPTILVINVQEDSVWTELKIHHALSTLT